MASRLAHTVGTTVLVYAKSRDPSKAEKLLLAQLARDSTQMHILQELGKLYFHTGDYANAFRYQSVYKHMHLALYAAYRSDEPGLIDHLRRFSEEENYQYWVLLFHDMRKPREIDLHLRAFRRNTSGMSAEAMIKASIERMRAALDDAIDRGDREIRFIHGHGAGTLRDRVYEELQKYMREGDIESFEPSFFNPDIVVVRIGY